MSRTALEVKASRKPKFSSRAYNRCPICGRPLAFMRQFGICRICFRNMALRGDLPGVRKSSWYSASRTDLKDGGTPKGVPLSVSGEGQGRGDCAPALPASGGRPRAGRSLVRIRGRSLTWFPASGEGRILFRDTFFTRPVSFLLQILLASR